MGASDLIISMSPERLARYRSAVMSDDIALTLELYDWNLQISEAFYIPLHFFEICLRNRIASALSSDFGVDWFFDHMVPMEPDSRLEIHNAKLKLRSVSPSSGQIIAELSLGFWVSLLGPRYDATLWRRSIYKVFRSASRPRKLIHSRLNALRRLRNRIAHHEPVFDRALGDDYLELIEAITWMCPDTAAKAETLSRVSQVLLSRSSIAV